MYLQLKMLCVKIPLENYTGFSFTVKQPAKSSLISAGS